MKKVLAPIYPGKRTYRKIPVSKKVFVDKNGNWRPDAGDQFVGRVHVLLDGKFSEATDTSGSYYFRKVTPGKHIISLDINSVPMNLLPVGKLQNEIEVTEGTTYALYIPLKVTEQQ